MKKSVLSGGTTFALLLFPLLSFTGCYATVEVGDSSAEKAIAIDWVEPPCAEPGSDAGYIEGNGFGAENVTITVDGIEAVVLAATGKDASFVVPLGLSPGPIEVVVENPGGRLATIDWRVCEPDCSAIDCDDGNECTTDTCDPAVEECVHTPVGDGAACDFDGLAGVCIAGVCEKDALCPVLTNVLATPPQANVGDEIDVSAEASSTGPIDYLWTATAGTFADTTAPITTYRCEEAGQQDLTITISDGTGSCTDATTVTVTCLGSPDLDPPVLTDFDFNPKSVDVSTGEQTVTCNMRVTDSGVGVKTASCTFQGPTQATGCHANAPSSGDIFDGIWTCTATIPPSVEPGIWTAWLVQVADNLDSYQQYQTADLQALGFPTELEVISSNPDTDPPELVDFDFNPKSVDVSTGEQTVTCNMRVTDSGVGVKTASCTFQGPTQATGCHANAPSSGDIFDGIWTCTATIPPSVEPGIWTAWLVQVADNLDSYQQYQTADLQALGFPTELEVISSNPDTDPPELVDFDFNPKSVDVSTGEQTVTCNMRVTDSGVGVKTASCTFQGPTQATGCHANAPSSGDIFDGIWTCTATIPPSVEPGIWTAWLVQVADNLDSYQQYQTADLQALGFPTELDVNYGGGDTDAPVLTEFDFNPKSVDVSSSPATTTCTARLIDDGVGTTSFQCKFRSPTQQQYPSCSASSPISGDAFDGIWSCSITIPQGAPAGTWETHEIFATDAVGNHFFRVASQMASLGFPTDLTVTSAGGGDTDAPVLTEFDFNPKSVDVSSSPATTTCTARLIDDGVGTTSFQCKFRSPTQQQYPSCSASSPISGDAFDGIWSCSITIPQGAPAGTWETHEIFATDAVGNHFFRVASQMASLGFPTDLTVTSAGGGDTDAPVLTEFDFNPKSVDVSSSPATTTCTARLIDDGVGTTSFQCKFRSPTQQQYPSCSASSPISGDAFDGIWSCSITIPQGAPAGTWETHEIFATDAVGNHFFRVASQMASLGFPTDLTVTSQ